MLFAKLHLSIRILPIVFIAALIAPHHVLADEFRPAYLQLRQLDQSTYDVLWKVPALDVTRALELEPVFPAGTAQISERSPLFANNSVVTRWKIRIAGGLAGKAVEFPGLSRVRTDVLISVTRSDGTQQVARLSPFQKSVVITKSPGFFDVAITYMKLGVSHILLGFDHLLFVLALTILVNGTRRLIVTITAFTLAHSLTLAAASLGRVHVPGPPVEAMIALSIVFVAGEIVHAQNGRPGITRRYPWIVAFTFGLLHGLGFAGALAEIGLPPLQIPAALLCFNLGVEVGQLAFIGCVLASIGAFKWIAGGTGGPVQSTFLRAVPYAIGGIASYWAIARIAAF